MSSTDPIPMGPPVRQVGAQAGAGRAHPGAVPGRDRADDVDAGLGLGGREDLATIFLTGIPGVNQPKTLRPAEMLRLNTSSASSAFPMAVGSPTTSWTPRCERLRERPPSARSTTRHPTTSWVTASTPTTRRSPVPSRTWPLRRTATASSRAPPTRFCRARSPMRAPRTDRTPNPNEAQRMALMSPPSRSTRDRARPHHDHRPDHGARLDDRTSAASRSRVLVVLAATSIVARIRQDPEPPGGAAPAPAAPRRRRCRRASPSSRRARPRRPTTPPTGSSSAPPTCSGRSRRSTPPTTTSPPAPSTGPTPSSPTTSGRSSGARRSPPPSTASSTPSPSPTSVLAAGPVLGRRPGPPGRRRDRARPLRRGRDPPPAVPRPQAGRRRAGPCRLPPASSRATWPARSGRSPTPRRPPRATPPSSGPRTRRRGRHAARRRPLRRRPTGLRPGARPRPRPAGRDRRHGTDRRRVGPRPRAIAALERLVERVPLPARPRCWPRCRNARVNRPRRAGRSRRVRAIDQLQAAAGSDVELDIAVFDADHAPVDPAAVQRALATYQHRPERVRRRRAGLDAVPLGRRRGGGCRPPDATRLGTADAQILFHQAMILDALGRPCPARRRSLDAAARGNPFFSIARQPEARALAARLGTTWPTEVPS